MKICAFSDNEIRAILTAMDYLDFCLEDVDTNPAGWNNDQASAAFRSSRDKLSRFDKDTTLTKDECLFINTVLYHYFYTAQPGDSPREVPEDALQAFSAKQKIEHMLSA